MHILRFLFLSLTLIAYDYIDCQSFKVKLTEHSVNVETVAFSYDGKQFASGAWDGTINLYTFDTSNNPIIKATYSGHLGAVTSLIFSKNGKYLVSASKDFSARVWNIDTPTKHKVFNLHMEPVTAAFLDAKNKYLITASLDGTIRNTLLENATKSKSIKLNGPILDLQLSKDFKFYFVAFKGGSIKKFQTTGKNLEVLSFVGHTDDINDLQLSPDGKYLASASNDKSIILWDVNSGKSYKKLSGFEWKVTSIKFSSDGNYIVGGCNNGNTKLFEVATEKLVSEFNELGMNVRDVAINRDGSLIIIATLMEGEKFGAVIYNSGITTAVANETAKKPNSASVKSKTNSKPTPKRK
ncbi:MAG: WD40 repeat domain-containing protein [Bacteroidia bacterium]|nr:WD40 repeat domain-containing protein [Bacteroidia bacterium]